MNKNFKTIIFCWGGIFALGTILIHLLIHYVIPPGQLAWKNILDIAGLLFSFFCIYKTVYAYRTIQDDQSSFVALQGIKISMGMLCVFSILFFAYSLIFYNFVNKTFVEDYKQKRVEYVQESDLSEEEKEQHIKVITSITTTSYVVSNLLQCLVFPLMGMLFIVAFMQRKPRKAVEVKSNENQQF